VVNQSTGTYDFQTDSGIVQGFGGGGTLTNAGDDSEECWCRRIVNHDRLANSKNITVSNGNGIPRASFGTSTGGTFTVSSGATLTSLGSGRGLQGTYTGWERDHCLVVGNMQVAPGGATFQFPGTLFSVERRVIDTCRNTFRSAAVKRSRFPMAGRYSDGGRKRSSITAP